MVLSEASSCVYGVMVDSIQLQKDGATWDIKLGQIYAKTEGAGISIAYTYNDVTSDSISADIGKPIPVTITANLPTYPADATVASKESTITLPSDFASGSIKFNSSDPAFDIICGTISSGAGNGLAEVSCNADRISVSIKLNTQFTVSTSSAIITYNKILNTHATIGGAGNQATVTMKYPDAYDSSKILTSEATGTRLTNHRKCRYSYMLYNI